MQCQIDIIASIFEKKTISSWMRQNEIISSFDCRFVFAANGFDFSSPQRLLPLLFALLTDHMRFSVAHTSVLCSACGCSCTSKSEKVFVFTAFAFVFALKRQTREIIQMRAFALYGVSKWQYGMYRAHPREPDHRSPRSMWNKKKIIEKGNNNIARALKNILNAKATVVLVSSCARNTHKEHKIIKSNERLRRFSQKFSLQSFLLFWLTFLFSFFSPLRTQREH